jgi:Tfp pilus assembly protein PilE
MCLAASKMQGRVERSNFKQVLAKMLALQTYMENFLGNANSHLSLGTNKVKSYQNCFELFHRLDDDV